MKRFLLLWFVLSPTYLVVAALSSWFFLNRLDLTFAAVASWLVVPPAQALVLCVTRRGDGVLRPRGRPPVSAAVAVSLGIVLLVAGLVRPHDAAFGMAAPGGIQPVVRRLLLLVAGGLFLAAALRARGGARIYQAMLGVLLVAVGADVVLPWLAAAPLGVFRGEGLFVPAAVVYGSLLAVGTALALAARPGRDNPPWTAKLVNGAVAVVFVAAHAAALNYVRRPWLSPPWDALVPAASTGVAILLVAAGVTLLFEESPLQRSEAAP